jgi:hypothetical protein
MSPNPAGTVGGGWAWDVVADRTGFYEITATVVPTEPDPNAANNTTTFRFEVANPAPPGGSAAPRAVASATRLTPASPRAGSPFSAGVRVSVDGSAVRPSGVTCTGTIAGRKLRGTPRALVGQAICTYRPPLAAKGQRVRGSVVVSASGSRLVRRFTVRLR